MAYITEIEGRIRKFWRLDSVGKHHVDKSIDSIPTIFHIETALERLGKSQPTHKETNRGGNIDMLMLLLIDVNWSRPINNTLASQFLVALLAEITSVNHVIRQLKEAQALRKLVDTGGIRTQTDSLFDNLHLKGLNEWRTDVNGLFVNHISIYAEYLEELVRRDLKLSTIQRLGLLYVQATTEQGLYNLDRLLGELKKKKALSALIVYLKYIDSLNGRLVEFEIVWLQLLKHIDELPKELTDDKEIAKKVSDATTLFWHNQKQKEKQDFLLPSQKNYLATRLVLIQRLVERQVKFEKRKAFEKSVQRARPLRESEKVEFISAERDETHPLEDLILKNDPQAKATVALFEYLRRHIVITLTVVVALKAFYNGLSPAGSPLASTAGQAREATIQVVKTLLNANDQELLHAFYLLLSDKRYNPRLYNLKTDEDITLGHNFFHHFVHIINGIFLLMEIRPITHTNVGDLQSIKAFMDSIFTNMGSQPVLQDMLKNKPDDALRFALQNVDDYLKGKLLDFMAKFLVRWILLFEQVIPPSSSGVDNSFATIFEVLTDVEGKKFYTIHYETIIAWLKENGEPVEKSWMRYTKGDPANDPIALQSRFFRPNSREPSALSSAMNTFLSMEADPDRDQTALSRIVWAPKVKEIEEKQKEREEKSKKKEKTFLRPLCSREQEDDKDLLSQLTEQMFCPREMTDLANAALGWAIDNFEPRIPKGSFFTLISRLLDSPEFFSMRTRYGFDPSARNLHAYQYKFATGAQSTSPFERMMALEDVESSYRIIDEEFARVRLNELARDVPGSLKGLQAMAQRYDTKKDAIHEVWRLVLFGRTTNPHLVIRGDTMPIEDVYLLVDFLVDLDRIVQKFVNPKESFQPLAILQSVWMFLKRFIMPLYMHQTIFLQQYHEDGRLLYDYFTPYAMTYLLRDHRTYGLVETSPEPITWQWAVQKDRLEHPYATREETFVERMKKSPEEQDAVRVQYAHDTLEGFVFAYQNKQEFGRILGQWDRAVNPYDADSDLITGSGFVFFNNRTTWTDVSPFSGLDLHPVDPEFPYGRDGSYDRQTTQFEADNKYAIYEWRAERVFYLRPSIARVNVIAPDVTTGIEFSQGDFQHVRYNELMSIGFKKNFHLWPVFVAENHDLIKWYNRWTRMYDSRPSLNGFYRLYEENWYTDRDTTRPIEQVFLDNRNNQLRGDITRRLKVLKEELIKILNEFKKVTGVPINEAALADGIIGKKLRDALPTNEFDEASIRPYMDMLRRAEVGLEDYKKMAQNWMHLFVAEFERAEWIPFIPDVASVGEDPNIYEYKFKELSEYSPFPAY